MNIRPKKISSGKNKGKYKTPNGRILSEAQVDAFYKSRQDNK